MDVKPRTNRISGEELAGLGGRGGGQGMRRPPPTAPRGELERPELALGRSEKGATASGVVGEECCHHLLLGVAGCEGRASAVS